MSLFRRIFAFVKKYEFALFLLGVAALLSEVFATTWLVTEDGAAHIYNAVITKELLAGHGLVAGSIFKLNAVIVPNYLGHAILSLLTSLFPLATADKIFHVLLVAGMCFSFRFAALKINPSQPFSSWLIFPFVYNGIFYLGFYNFYLGVVLALLATGTWIVYFEKKEKRTFAWLVVLCTLLFFTHLIPLLVFVFIAGLSLLFRGEKKEFFSGCVKLFAALIPSLILFSLYYAKRTEASGVLHWAKPAESFKYYFTLKELAVHSINETYCAILLSGALLLLAAISVFVFVRNRRTQSAAENRRFIFWGLCWLFIFALIFISPDDFGGSGAMVFRLSNIAWFLFLLFLAAGKLSEKILMPAAALSLLIAVVNVNIRSASNRERNNDAVIVMRLSKEIRENSTGVYIPLTSLWLRLHIGELAFAEKKAAMLSNYETTHDFFPLKWQDNFPYDYRVGGLQSENLWCGQCFWPAQPGKPQKQVDYVLLCKDENADTTCYNKMADSLQKYYTLKKEEFPFSVWEIKKEQAK